MLMDSSFSPYVPDRFSDSEQKIKVNLSLLVNYGGLYVSCGARTTTTVLLGHDPNSRAARGSLPYQKRTVGGSISLGWALDKLR